MIGPILGSLCLGVVLGWLVRYFLDRFKTFNTKVFGSVVSILCGGVVAKLLPDPFGYWGWFYPVGLLLGVLLYPLISAFDAWVDMRKTASRASGTGRK